MTETISPAESQAAGSPRLARPETDGAALRAIEEATAHLRERALQIRQNPEEHKPRLVLSQHVRGTSCRSAPTGPRRPVTAGPSPTTRP
jgi:hypothetical protein